MQGCFRHICRNSLHRFSQLLVEGFTYWRVLAVLPWQEPSTVVVEELPGEVFKVRGLTIPPNLAGLLLALRVYALNLVRLLVGHRDARCGYLTVRCHNS
jgi:hypothetical protein